MPIYEYQCAKCEHRYEEYLSTSTKPAPPCPGCGSKKVERKYSSISLEWYPNDVKWHRLGGAWETGLDRG